MVVAALRFIGGGLKNLGKQAYQIRNDRSFYGLRQVDPGFCRAVHRKRILSLCAGKTGAKMFPTLLETETLDPVAQNLPAAKVLQWPAIDLLRSSTGLQGRPGCVDGR
jgi:hypothetical protein